MSEQFLNRAQVGALFKHVRAEGVAQGVRVNVWGEPFGDGNFLDDPANAASGQTATAAIGQQCGRILAR